jgi:transposase
MSRTPYTPEYRAHLVALVREGRTPESLAREFEPMAVTIRAWVEAAKVAERGGIPIDKGRRIRELERDNARLKEEREVLENAAACFATKGGSTRKMGSRS